MAATFAGADTVGTAVTSENAPATIAPITIERIASSLVTHQPTLAGRSELINRLLSSSADAGCSRGRGRNRVVVESCPNVSMLVPSRDFISRDRPPRRRRRPNHIHGRL